jgi:hypothetical protein
MFMERFFLLAVDGDRPERELPRPHDYGCGEVRVVIVVLAIHTERRWSRALKCFEVTDFVPAKRFSVR